MYSLGTWFVWGICVWIPYIKETMMMMMMMMMIIIIIIIIHNVDILQSTVGAEMLRNIPYDESKTNSSFGLQLLNIVEQCVDRTKVHFVAYCIIHSPVSLPPKSLYPSCALQH